MKYVFIINPSAGTENSVGMIREAVNRSEKKDQCEIYVTRGVNDATEYVRAYSSPAGETGLLMRL